MWEVLAQSRLFHLSPSILFANLSSLEVAEMILVRVMQIEYEEEREMPSIAF